MGKGIGSILREKRISSGMTVKEISNRLTKKGFKASEKTIYSWENGNSHPNPDALLELCDAYGIKDILPAFGYDGYKENGSIQLNIKEVDLIEKYRSLDDYGRETIRMILEREISRAKAAQDQANTISDLTEKAENNSIKTRVFAYYGKIAAAGKSVGFEDIIEGTREYPETDINKHADYVIGVSGESMEPTFCDGNIVYVKKTYNLQIGDIGIFQKDNQIYIKEVGESALLSHNSNYEPMTGDGDVICLGKVIGKAE